MISTPITGKTLYFTFFSMNRGRGFFDPADGKVYINASRVRPHEVLELMLHEAVGHKGLRAVVPGEQLEQMLDNVYKAHFNDEEFQRIASRYFPEAIQRLTDENGEEYFGVSLEDAAQQREAAEEYIAHIAQKGVPKPSWWKQFLQQIRMLFGKFKWAEDAVLLDSQIETVLALAARRVRKGAVVKEYLTTGEGVRFAETDDYGQVRTGTDGEERTYYAIPFAESVDAILSKKNIGDGLIFVSNTPEPLQKVGIPALPIMMTRRHIKDIYNDYAPGGRNAHGMGEQLKSLPQMLKKPVAVIAAEQNDRVIVITQYKDKSGNDIMVPVIIGAETTAQGNIRITANIAASTYGKRSVSDMLSEAIEKENSGDIAIFGANKKIASKLSLRGLQLTQWSGFEAVHNINDKNSPVKLDIEKNTKSLQFEKWLDRKSVV